MSLNRTTSMVLGLGFAAALTLGVASPAAAAPAADGAGLKLAVPAASTEVQWGHRRWHRGWGWRHYRWGWRHRHHRHWRYGW